MFVFMYERNLTQKISLMQTVLIHISIKVGRITKKEQRFMCGKDLFIANMEMACVVRFQWWALRTLLIASSVEYESPIIDRSDFEYQPTAQC